MKTGQLGCFWVCLLKNVDSWDISSFTKSLCVGHDVVPGLTFDVDPIKISLPLNLKQPSNDISKFVEEYIKNNRDELHEMGTRYDIVIAAYTAGFNKATDTDG